MNKKVVYTIIVILVILVIGYLFLARNKAQAPTTESQTNSANTNSDAANAAPVPSGQTQTIQNAGGSDYQPSPTPSTTTPPSGTRFSGEGDIEGNDVMVQEVTFNGTSFSPAALTVKVGDIVLFKNTSSAGLHVVADNKTAYPEFDSKGVVAAGDQFDFKFIKTGTWAYHDALHTAAKATITVTK